MLHGTLEPTWTLDQLFLFCSLHGHDLHGPDPQGSQDPPVQVQDARAQLGEVKKCREHHSTREKSCFATSGLFPATRSTATLQSGSSWGRWTRGNEKNKFPPFSSLLHFFTKSIAFLYRKPQMFYEVEDASEVVIEDGDIIAARCTMVRKNMHC